MLIADIENGTTLLHKSIETHSKFMARRNYELANYAQCVERQLRLDGYKIVKVIPDGEITDTIDKLREIRNTNVENYCEAVPQADISDELELKRIAAKQERDLDERLKFEKKKLSDRYLIPVTPQLVKQDMDGIYSKLRLNYYLTIGAEYLSDRDKASVETLLGDDNLLFAPDANKWLLAGKIALLHKIGLPDFLANVGNDELTNCDSRAIDFNQKLISDFSCFPLLRHFGLKIDPKAKPLTNIEKVLGRIGKNLIKDAEKKKQKKAGGYQIISIFNLDAAIFDAWLKRDFRERNDNSKSEMPILRRQLPNNNICSEELTTIADSQKRLREHSIMAIAPNPEYDNDGWEDIPPSELVEEPVMAISSNTPQLKVGVRVKYIGNRFQSIYGGDRILTVSAVNGFEITCERPDTGTFTTWIKADELAIAPTIFASPPHPMPLLVTLKNKIIYSEMKIMGKS